MLKQRPEEWRAYVRVELTPISWVLLAMAASAGFVLSLLDG